MNSSLKCYPHTFWVWFSEHCEDRVDSPQGTGMKRDKDGIQSNYLRFKQVLSERLEFHPRSRVLKCLELWASHMGQVPIDSHFLVPICHPPVLLQRSSISGRVTWLWWHSFVSHMTTNLPTTAIPTHFGKPLLLKRTHFNRTERFAISRIRCIREGVYQPCRLAGAQEQLYLAPWEVSTVQIHVYETLHSLCCFLLFLVVY